MCTTYISNEENFYRFVYRFYHVRVSKYLKCLCEFEFDIKIAFIKKMTQRHEEARVAILFDKGWQPSSYF